MSVDKIISEKLVKPEIKLLEGGVLIHGFKGNIPTINEYQEVQNRLKKVIETGAIVSPSKRDLSESEQARLSDAPFDYNRVCFHAWHDDVENNRANYVLDSVFVIPVSSVEGLKLSLDPAMDNSTVSTYSENGVEIPLDKGILFLSIELFENLIPDIKFKAESIGISFENYVKNNVVILPKRTFEDKNILWNEVSNRIAPARGTNLDLINPNDVNSNSINFVEVIKNIKPATNENLGISNKIDGSPVGNDYFSFVIEECHQNTERIKKIGKNIKKYSHYLEYLRNPTFIQSVDKLRSFVKQFLPEDPRMNTVEETSNHFLEYFRRLAVRAESDVIKRFPDAPTLTDEEIQRIVEPNGSEPYVYRDKTGIYHVAKSGLFTSHW